MGPAAAPRISECPVDAGIDNAGRERSPFRTAASKMRAIRALRRIPITFTNNLDIRSSSVFIFGEPLHGFLVCVAVILDVLSRMSDGHAAGCMLHYDRGLKATISGGRFSRPRESRRKQVHDAQNDVVERQCLYDEQGGLAS